MTSDKPVPASNAVTTRKTTVGVSGLHARMRQPNVTAQSANPETCPNRIALMLDASGSMHGDKIEALRAACVGFVNSCNFVDTSLAIEPIGEEAGTAHRLPLTTQHPMLMTTIQMLRAYGGTPIAEAMDYVLNTYSITRAVLVSDGVPDHAQSCFDLAQNYREAGIPIDCVHIGEGQNGEACLRHIAEITGGQYIKFTDIASFSRSFKYLTPAYYAMLTSGALSADALGAKELK